MSVHLLFLEMAKKDLDASRLLFSRKYYPQAVFLFQQAVEKGVKSLGLWANVITEEECKRTEVIGHKAWKTFSFIIEIGLKAVDDSLQTILKENRDLEQTDLWKNVKTQMLNLEREARETPVEMKNMKDLENWAFSEEKMLDIMNKINRFKGKLPKGFLKFGGVEIKTWRELYRLLLQDLDRINQLSHVNMKEIMKSSKIAWKLIFSTASLFYLSLIASPHATSSRYPEKEQSPIEKYRETTPLVKRLKFFINSAQEALDNLSEIYIKFQPVEVKY
jgi:HEPN domain-containing protein